MTDIIVGLIVVIIVGAALSYIRKEKKKGARRMYRLSQCRQLREKQMRLPYRIRSKNPFRPLQETVRGFFCACIYFCTMLYCLARISNER